MQKKICLGLALTLVTVVFIPVYWATEAGRQAAAQERFKTEAVIRGAHLFTTYCVICHGSKGDAIPGRNLSQTKLGEAGILKQISLGGTGMPPFSREEGGPLKKPEINDLTTFVRNWDQSLIKVTPTPTPVPVLTPGPVPTTAIPVAQAVELFAGRCAICHGANRQGVPGLGPALTPESLSQLDDTRVEETIRNGRTGTAMPPFKDLLAPEEIDALIQLIKRTSP